MGCANSKAATGSGSGAKTPPKKGSSGRLRIPLTPGRSAVKEMTKERALKDAKARERSSMLHNLVHEEFRRNINEVYDLSGGVALGKGSFGTVRRVKHRTTGEQFAMKSVELKGLKDPAMFEEFMNEIEIMKKLDHPNIARLQEVYHMPDYVFMVMDVYTGGDLVDRGRVNTEADAADVMNNILSGIRYCHEHRIAHRDLKLENLLYEHKGPDALIKIVDFGLGVSTTENMSMMRDIVGTWIYMSPEVIKGEHNPYAADMWSIGVIAYTLLVGNFPFMADNLQMLQHKIQFGQYSMAGEEWEEVSADAKDFIKRLLVKDPDRRMTAAEALQHPWISTSRAAGKSKNKTLDRGIASRLKNFKEYNAMKRIALEMVARTLEPEHIRALETEFRKADKTDCGEIDRETFRQVMQEAALLRKEEIDNIFTSLDIGNTGKIHFTDFLAASLKWQKLDENRLRVAFDRLDHGHTGFITVDDLQFTVGADLTKHELQEAVRSFDKDGDGKICFEDFCAAMRKSGADLGVLSTATITGKNYSRMSKVVSRTTLQRLAEGDGELDVDMDAVPEGDEDGGDGFTQLQRRFSDVGDHYAGKTAASSSAERSSLSKNSSSDDVDRAQLSVAADALLKLQCNVQARRATSETGVELSSSIHASRKAKLELAAAREAARGRKNSGDAGSALSGLFIGGEMLNGLSSHSRNGTGTKKGSPKPLAESAALS